MWVSEAFGTASITEWGRPTRASGLVHLTGGDLCGQRPNHAWLRLLLGQILGFESLDRHEDRHPSTRVVARHLPRMGDAKAGAEARPRSRSGEKRRCQSVGSCHTSVPAEGQPHARRSGSAGRARRVALEGSRSKGRAQRIALEGSGAPQDYWALTQWGSTCRDQGERAAAIQAAPIDRAADIGRGPRTGRGDPRTGRAGPSRPGHWAGRESESQS
jgi:hypothetical protein